MDVTNKVAIVTGASRGIGRQIALELARRGARVVVAARTVEARRRLPGAIGETLAMIEAAGGQALAVQTDVSVPADCERLVARTIEAFGRLDILVNNAAETQGEGSPLESYSRAGWTRQFDANVHAPFTLMSLAVPHMRQVGGGVIVNITSGAGDLIEVDLSDTHPGLSDGLGNLVGYAATKAALNRMTNYLAPQLARDNIAAACVDPGYTRTEFVGILAAQGLIDDAAAHGMELPVAKVIEIITAANPLTYAGQIVRTAAYEGKL